MKAFGVDVVKKDRGFFGVRKCSQCGCLVDVNLVDLVGVERFLFIPVSKYMTKHYLHCSKCECLFSLTDEQWAHYQTYLHERLPKSTTDEIIKVLDNINKTYIENGVVIDIDNSIYHPALDDICDTLIKKYGHKESMEEIMSVYFIAKYDDIKP